MSTLTITGTKVLNDILKSQDSKIIVLEGGSRSSKTWSILQYFIQLALTQTGKTFRFARAKMTWTKETILDDWETLVNLYKLPVEPYINKNRPDQTYTLNGNKLIFIGLDDPQKLHGMRSDYFWINEAIEADQKSFDQLEMRTTKQAILDYNPSTETHWIYDAVIPRPDATFLHSTMLDNPFLPKTIIDKIKSYEPTEENKKRGTADEINWKIYGLGKRASLRGVIFNNWQIVNNFPEDYKWVIYGLDFGYTNDPTALVKIALHNGELWIHEMIYATGLTNPDIVERLNLYGISKSTDIIADSAEPKSIAEIRRYGFRIFGAEKGPDSVKNGIDIMKRYKLNVTDKSVNIIKELRNYRWKDDEKAVTKQEGGNYLNEPVDNFNHAIDAARYAIMKMCKNKSSFVI